MWSAKEKSERKIAGDAPTFVLLERPRSLPVAEASSPPPASGFPTIQMPSPKEKALVTIQVPPEFPLDVLLHRPHPQHTPLDFLLNNFFSRVSAWIEETLWSRTKNPRLLLLPPPQSTTTKAFFSRSSTPDACFPSLSTEMSSADVPSSHHVYTLFRYHRLLEVVIPRTIGSYSFQHLFNNLFQLPYLQLVQNQPCDNICSALVRSVRPARAFSCAGLVDASFNTRFFLRGSKQIVVCSLSGRLASNYLGRRAMTTGGGSGRTAEQLLAWERSLKEQQQHINCEKMSVDCSRLAVYASWTNLRNVHGRLPPPGLIGGFKKFALENFNTYLLKGITYGGACVFFSLVILESLKPGEAKKLPGNIMAALSREFLELQTSLRKNVGLEVNDKHITGPVAPFPPSSVVVILGGSYPIFKGSVLYGSSSQGASRKAKVEDGVGALKAKGEDGEGKGAGK